MATASTVGHGPKSSDRTVTLQSEKRTATIADAALTKNATPADQEVDGVPALKAASTGDTIADIASKVAGGNERNVGVTVEVRERGNGIGLGTTVELDIPTVALPELVKAGVKRDLDAYCERRVQPHARHHVRMGFSIRGHHVTLFEERAPYDGKGAWAQIPIAQLRWDPEHAIWALYACDRNRRWFAYRYAEPAPHLGALLGALDADRTGIFWG